MANGEAAVFRARRGAELARAVLPSTLLVPVVVWQLVEEPRAWSAWLLALTAAVVIGVVLVRHLRRTGRTSWRVKVDAVGISYVATGSAFDPTGPLHLPWDSLHSLRRTAPPARLVWVPWLSEAVRLADESQARFAAHIGEEPVEHVLATRYLDGSTDDLLAAMARFAPPEVWRRLQPPTVRPAAARPPGASPAGPARW